MHIELGDYIHPHAVLGNNGLLPDALHLHAHLLYRNDEKDDFALYYDKPTFEAITALSAAPEWSSSRTAITPRCGMLSC